MTMMRLAATALLVTMLTGCVSQNVEPGRREIRLDSLGAYVTSHYRSLTVDDLRGVEQVAYFATHGVRAPKMPFLDPVCEKGRLEAEDGKPPASLCIVVGMEGAWKSNIACLCEARIRSHGVVDFHTFILAWDEKSGAWRVGYSAGP